MMALMNPRTSAATASVPYESTCTPGRILEQTNSASAVLIQCTRNRPMVSFPPSALRLSEECLTSGPRPPNGTDPRQRPSVRQVGVDVDRRRLVRGVIEKDPIAREAEREPLLSGRERKGRAGDGRRLDLDRELHQSFLLERPGHRLFIRDEQHADGPGVDGPRARLAAQAHDDGRESVQGGAPGCPEPGLRPSVAVAVLHDGAAPRADFLALAGLGRAAARWTGHRSRCGAARLRPWIHASPSATSISEGGGGSPSGCPDGLLAGALEPGVHVETIRELRGDRVPIGEEGLLARVHAPAVSAIGDLEDGAGTEAIAGASLDVVEIGRGGEPDSRSERHDEGVVVALETQGGEEAR